MERDELEKANGASSGGSDADGAGLRPLPRRRNSWPIFVILASALLLPVLIVVGTARLGGASGEAQFEALFVEDASARAAALDYWSVTFRGSAPRIYNSTLVDDALNERMRTASDDAVLDFHRVFSQDPDYLFHFRPVAVRALALSMRLSADRAGELVRGAGAADGAAIESLGIERSRALAQMEEVLRAEQAAVVGDGPMLTAADQAGVVSFYEAAARSVVWQSSLAGWEAGQRRAAALELMNGVRTLGGEAVRSVVRVYVFEVTTRADGIDADDLAMVEELNAMLDGLEDASGLPAAE